jgi:site-specific DNA-methyltransferase (adenine-specific)
VKKMAYEIITADCFLWLKTCPPASFHAVVTDPPFGVREFTQVELEKLKNRNGGVWRIPPAIGGSQRSPLPRFTVLTAQDVEKMRTFFLEWSRLILPVLVPGGHVLIAATPLWSHVVFSALTQAGLEKRGEIVRLVRTLRGGDRPKGAEEEFPNVSAMPRSCWEPWGVFRRPLDGTLAENLRRWGTGGLRRLPDGNPFPDVIDSTRTPHQERKIAPHPSLKPQKFLRQLVWAALPLSPPLKR